MLESEIRDPEDWYVVRDLTKSVDNNAQEGHRIRIKVLTIHNNYW